MPNLDLGKVKSLLSQDMSVENLPRLNESHSQVRKHEMDQIQQEIQSLQNQLSTKTQELNQLLLEIHQRKERLKTAKSRNEEKESNDSRSTEPMNHN